MIKQKYTAPEFETVEIKGMAVLSGSDVNQCPSPDFEGGTYSGEEDW